MDLVDKPALTTVFGVLFGWPNRLQTVNLLRPPTNFHSNAIPLTGRHADSHTFPPPPLRIRAMHTGLCISVCHSTNRIILLVSYFPFSFHFLETQPNESLVVADEQLDASSSIIYATQAELIETRGYCSPNRNLPILFTLFNGTLCLSSSLHLVPPSSFPPPAYATPMSLFKPGETNST